MRLHYDIKRICKATELCIDPIWGDHRMSRVREAVDSEDIKRNVWFNRNNEPLNELVKLGRQSKPAVYSLFQLALDKRSRLKPCSPRDSEIKDRKKVTTATHRRLSKLAVQIEEAKLGRRLTDEEQKELLAKKKREWVVKRVNFSTTHTGYKSRADAYDAANAEIEGNLRSELMRARANAR